jgi:hypothetical protein
LYNLFLNTSINYYINYINFNDSGFNLIFILQKGIPYFKKGIPYFKKGIFIIS